MTPRTCAVHDERGFTLLEMLMVVAIMATMAAMAVADVAELHPSPEGRGGGHAQALEVIRNARETAISQRRNVRIVFTGTNIIQTVRGEHPPRRDHDAPADGASSRTGCSSSVCRSCRTRPTRSPPDPLRRRRIAFGPSATRAFTSEGTLVDANGDVLNGTLFLGDSEPAEQRARDYGLRHDGAAADLAMGRRAVGGVG